MNIERGLSEIFCDKVIDFTQEISENLDIDAFYQGLGGAQNFFPHRILFWLTLRQREKKKENQYSKFLRIIEKIEKESEPEIILFGNPTPKISLWKFPGKS